MLIHPIYERLLVAIDEALFALGQEDGLGGAADYLNRWVEEHSNQVPADLAAGVEDAGKAIKTERALYDLSRGALVPVPGGLEFEPKILLDVFDPIRESARRVGHERAVEVCYEFGGTLDEPDEAIHTDPDEIVGVAFYYWGVITAARLLCQHFGVKPDDQ